MTVLVLSPATLVELYVWLSQTKPIKAGKLLSSADIAYLSLTPAEFEQVPGSSVWCEWREQHQKRWEGLVVCASRWPLPELHSLEDLSRRIAWKLTGCTQSMFVWERQGTLG